MTLFDLSQKIKSLVKEKKYAEALAVFKDEKVHFSKELIAKNGYLIGDIITCLRHSGNAAYVSTFLQIYNIAIDANTDDRIMNAYGWALHSQLKHENGDDHEEVGFFFEEDHIDGEILDDAHAEQSELAGQVVYFIVTFRPKMTGFNYTVISNLFKLLLKSESKKPNPNWDRINGICEILDVENLTTECFKTKMVIKGKEKEMEFASDRETWYAYKTKALLKLSRFDECYKLSKTALESFDKFHYSNDVWFARRMALSKVQIGSKEEAESELKALLKRRNEWFIHKELAELAHTAGRHEDALLHCKKGLAGHGDLEYKVGLLLITARILKEQNQKGLSDKHYHLLKLVRESEGWSIPLSLQNELAGVSTDVASIPDPGALLGELRRYWSEGTVSTNRLKGKVEKILNNNDKGVDGFIAATNGAKVYFRLDRGIPIAGKIKEKSDVSFEIISGKDGKLKANRIRLES